MFWFFFLVKLSDKRKEIEINPSKNNGTTRNRVRNRRLGLSTLIDRSGRTKRSVSEMIFFTITTLVIRGIENSNHNSSTMFFNQNNNNNNKFQRARIALSFIDIALSQTAVWAGDPRARCAPTLGAGRTCSDLARLRVTHSAFLSSSGDMSLQFS